jgi:cephalosporin-C deacetylase
MVFVDIPLDQLRDYRSDAPEPDDFGEFWAQTMHEAEEHPLDVDFRPYDTGLRSVDTFDTEFTGFNGQRVKAWLLVPRGLHGQVPCVVEYLGYGRGRGLPHDWLLWSAAGYAHFIMDTRGQGGVLFPGDTADLGADGASQSPGFVTRGVLDRHAYYYRRLFTDAVRAVSAARAHRSVDADRIVAAGDSQGGGIALAVAGLVPDLAATMPNVPFLCHFRRGATITDAAPYAEIATFCGAHRDRWKDVFGTLDYFDGVNFAAHATAPALFSVGLMDAVCPPSTVFAAYNAYAGPKQIREWAFNGHEGGMGAQTRERIAFLAKLFPDAQVGEFRARSVTAAGH